MNGVRMAKSDITKKPKRKARDVAHTLARAGIAAIPVVGGSANELLSLVLAPSLEKRRDRWLESIAEALKELEEKVEGFKIENLQEDESFVSTVMHATQVALRTHQKEKLQALRNAVLNATLPNAPEADLRIMFLDFVDSFTPWHLAILKFCDSIRGGRRDWQRGRVRKAERLGTNSDGCERALYEELQTRLPELSNRAEFRNLIVGDLYGRGLIAVTEIIARKGMFLDTSSRVLTTPFGQRFIRFITSPIESESKSGGAKEKSQ